MYVHRLPAHQSDEEILVDAVFVQHEFEIALASVHAAWPDVLY